MKILFIIPGVYHCHSLMELFRLRDVFKADATHCYRYTKGNEVFDKYFKWEHGEWIEDPEGTGFQKLSFESLEKNWKFLCRMKN